MGYKGKGSGGKVTTTCGFSPFRHYDPFTLMSTQAKLSWSFCTREKSNNSWKNDMIRGSGRTALTEDLLESRFSLTEKRRSPM